MREDDEELGEQITKRKKTHLIYLIAVDKGVIFFASVDHATHNCCESCQCERTHHAANDDADDGNRAEARASRCHCDAGRGPGLAGKEGY